MADGKVKIDIVADDSDAQKKLENVEDAAESTGRKLEDLGDSAEGTGKSFGMMDAAAGDLISNGLQNLIGGLKDTAMQLIALADETREYREDMAKLSTAFTTAGHSSETANEAYKSFYKILGESDRSVEAVNHLAELTQNEQEVAQWATIAAGVTAKFGDSLPIEGLTEAANETAKVGQVTGVVADALNWAGVSEDEFNEKLAKCNSEQERATLITSTLNGLYSDAAAEYNELTKSTQDARAATAEMEEAQAAIGETIEPLTTAWTNLKAKAFEAMLPIVEKIVGAFQSISTWMEENPGKAVVIKAVIIALAAAFGVLAIALGISGIIQLVTTAMASLSGVMAVLTSPITLIIAGIAALVAAFLYLWNNCDAFREFWLNLWAKIVEIVEPIWEKIKEIFSAAWSKIQEIWAQAKPYFEEIWSRIKQVFAVVKEVLGAYFSSAWEVIKLVWRNATSFFSQIWQTIKTIFSVVKDVLSGNFSDAWAKIKGIFSSWKQFFIDRFNDIIGVFSKIGAKFKEIGGNLVAGIREGISNAWANLKEWFTGLFGDLIGIAKTILGIHSPSKEFAYIGKMTLDGLIDGAEGERKKAVETYASITEDVIGGVEKSLDDGISDIDKKLEHLDDIRTTANAKSIDAQKKALNKEKKALQERKSAFSEFARTHEKQLSEMAKLEDDYSKGMVKIQETLTSEIEKAWADFDSKRDSRADSIANSLSLFDAVEKKDARDGFTLTQNLAGQVKELEAYNKAISALSTRNVDSTFLAEMMGLGVDNLPELQALVRMSDDELSHYADLWAEKNRLAGEAASKSLEGAREETVRNVAGLIDAARLEAEGLTTEYQTAMTDLLKEVQTGMQGVSEAGVKALGEDLAAYFDAGRNLMENVADGIEDGKSTVFDALKSSIDAALTYAGIKEELQATVSAENARYGYTAGAADNGITELSHAVNAQNAGINSLVKQGASKGGTATVILQLDKREFGRAVVDTSRSEAVRAGIKV